MNIAQDNLKRYLELPKSIPDFDEIFQSYNTLDIKHHDIKILFSDNYSYYNLTSKWKKKLADLVGHKGKMFSTLCFHESVFK